VVVVKKLVVDL